MIRSPYAILDTMISVVIPAFNEGLYLGKCLQSLLHQDYNDDIEIIVVDNNSSDDTTDVARGFGVNVISETRHGVVWARQKGFKAARGEIIASTDADTVLPAGWLRQIESLFNNHPDALAIAGHYLLFDGPIAARTGIRIIFMMMPLIVKLTPEIWNFPGSNFAVKAEAFRDIGGFDTTTRLYDDVDLCRRLRRNGKVFYCPELVVHTSGRSYLSDPLALGHLFNYLSLLFVGKPVLPVILGAELRDEIKN